jgi:hypothetical protein
VTAENDPAEALDVVGEGQMFLSGVRIAGALALISPLDPTIAAVLRALNLRIYPGQPGDGDRSDYVVLDVHGVSIGVKRRDADLYLHTDTTETADTTIAFEVNGLGEHDHPTR